MSYEKENQGGADEFDRLEKEKEELEQHIYKSAKHPNIAFTFRPIFSMIDGKTKNTITGNRSTQSCSDCRATPKDVMEDRVEKFEVKNTKFLQYGAISLHFGQNKLKFLVNVASHLLFHKYYSPDNRKKDRDTKIAWIADELGAKTHNRQFKITPGGETSINGNLVRI